jgi:hypothetical protein
MMLFQIQSFNSCNLASFLFLWQFGMFGLATAFNGDISDWDVSSGTNFVSGGTSALDFD